MIEIRVLTMKLMGVGIVDIFFVRRYAPDYSVLPREHEMKSEIKIVTGE